MELKSSIKNKHLMNFRFGSDEYYYSFRLIGTIQTFPNSGPKVVYVQNLEIEAGHQDFVQSKICIGKMNSFKLREIAEQFKKAADKADKLVKENEDNSIEEEI
jgi:hypothetical protein